MASSALCPTWSGPRGTVRGRGLSRADPAAGRHGRVTVTGLTSPADGRPRAACRRTDRRRRPGPARAHLAAGTTVMHEGFVNYNAGTLGTSMVEGRISAGVVVGRRLRCRRRRLDHGHPVGWRHSRSSRSASAACSGRTPASASRSVTTLSQAGRGHGRRLPRDQRPTPRLRPACGSSAPPPTAPSRARPALCCRHASTASTPRRRWTTMPALHELLGRHRPAHRHRLGYGGAPASRGAGSRPPGAPRRPRRRVKYRISRSTVAATNESRTPPHARRLPARRAQPQGSTRCRMASAACAPCSSAASRCARA